MYVPRVFYFALNINECDLTTLRKRQSLSHITSLTVVVEQVFKDGRRARKEHKLNAVRE
jgi:hypothetical protein